MNPNIERLLQLAESVGNQSPLSVVELPKAGGDRTYYRFSYSDSSLIGVVSDNYKDSKSFVELSRYFSSRSINVPRVLAFSDDYNFYIEEDLGDQSLYWLLSSEDIEGLLCKTIDELVKLQTLPFDEWQHLVAYPPYCERQILWDLNYFKYEFLKVADIPFDEELLENDFEALVKTLLPSDYRLWGFMMRDCQSRNVMLKSNELTGNLEPWFIDYQGGRKGPCIYDVISLLWQAKAGFSAQFRSEMLEYYADKFCGVTGVEQSKLLSLAKIFALFRTLQVLGAYGYRGLVQKRAHFIESIPGAISNLHELLNEGILNSYPELKRVSQLIIGNNKFVVSKPDRLHIYVFSFSYKKGYPEDLSGNGGGFMFDCRGMSNPGRYKEYKSLTGRDKPVIDFLKDRGEADIFVNKVMDIVSPSIDRYIKRGFDSLQIGFGCTGGQHRSVYCAESVAHRISTQFPQVVVKLIHREQSINETFNDFKL